MPNIERHASAIEDNTWLHEQIALEKKTFFSFLCCFHVNIKSLNCVHIFSSVYCSHVTGIALILDKWSQEQCTVVTSKKYSLLQMPFLSQQNN